MPSTEAGKRLLASHAICAIWGSEKVGHPKAERAIDAIEAEAAAAEREQCLSILRNARNQVRTGDAFSALVATLDEAEEAIVNGDKPGL